MIISIKPNIAKRPEVNNDMDGVIEFEDLMGNSPVRNNPIDYDVLNSTEEGDFFNAAGKKPKPKRRINLLTGMRERKAKRQDRKDLRVKSKADARTMKAGAKVEKAGAKVLDAKGKIEAAKAAGKDDGSSKILAASMKQPAAAPTETGMSTSAKIGIGVGIAAVLVAIGFGIYKLSKKGK